MDIASNDDDSVDWMQSWNEPATDEVLQQQQPNCVSAHHVQGNFWQTVFSTFK